MKWLFVLPFRAIKFVFNFVFFFVWFPFWALSKIGKGVGAVMRWPFERGGAAELERQIKKAGMERVLGIRQSREGRGTARPSAPSGQRIPRKENQTRRKN